MYRKVTQRGRVFADRALAPFCVPMPLTKQEREQFAKQSRQALKRAEAAGVSDIKPNRNPANVKVS